VAVAARKVDLLDGAVAVELLFEPGERRVGAQAAHPEAAADDGLAPADLASVTPGCAGSVAASGARVLVVAEVLAAALLARLARRQDVGEADEGVGRVRLVRRLDVDLLDHAEALEEVAQLADGDVDLQVAHEERASGERVLDLLVVHVVGECGPWLAR